MWTLNEPPAATVAGPQASTCEPGAPVTEHRLAFDCVLIDQVTPGGSGSLTVTPCAVPRPLFETVTVNPIGSPSSTTAASAVFTMWIAAVLQVIDAVELSVPSLLDVTFAVLL